MVVDGLLHETIDFFGDFLGLVKKCLFLVVLPVQRQVHDSNRLPEVAKLRPRTIDHSGDFVRHYEFQILLTRHKHHRSEQKIDKELENDEWQVIGKKSSVISSVSHIREQHGAMFDLC